MPKGAVLTRFDDEVVLFRVKGNRNIGLEKLLEQYRGNRLAMVSGVPYCFYTTSQFN